MRVIKAETDIKPIPNPEQNVIIEDYLQGLDIGIRFRVKAVTEKVSLPNTNVFNPKPRSYVFGVLLGNESWYQVKFQEGEKDLIFDFPGEVVERLLRKQDDTLSVFLGYNDGFLGATFKEGFFSMKERILYWYCLARTRIDRDLEEYFVYGFKENFPLIINIEALLKKPKDVITRTITIGTPGLKIGGGSNIGDNYDG